MVEKRYLTIDDEYENYLVVDSDYCLAEELRIGIRRQKFFLNRETARMLRDAMDEWLTEVRDSDD